LFDQSFSVKNFRKIYDIDRKNKGDVEREHFPDAYRFRQKIYSLKKLISFLILRYKQGRISEALFEKRKELLNLHIDKRKEQYHEKITIRLQEIVERVNIKGYVLPLIQSPYQIRNKDVYSVGKSMDTLFVSRQLQFILSSIYDVKLNNRDIIVSRLSNIISDLSPKFIIRADVESFYESIKHDNLLAILHSSPRLSVTPRRILTQLIRAFAEITGEDVGLPRGVGISSYLSEVYMGNIDHEVGTLNDVIYYERYVDDLIVVFSPTKEGNINDYLNKVTKIIEKKDLKFNSKTKEIDLFNSKHNNFEYLGYKFRLNGNSHDVLLSSNKAVRNRNRIDESFNSYTRESSRTKKRASKNLVSRIRFLTGNTRLYNSKANAFVGVYFSNKYITNTSDLRGLDQYLKNKITSITDSKLANRLNKLSFEEGFNKKVFRKFTIHELSKISKAWKHG